MASSSISAYKNNTTQVTFVLVSTSQDSCLYKVSGRPLSTPFGVEVKRSIVQGTRNDHISLRVFETEQNQDTAQLATAQVMLDISIPKDQSVITASVMADLVQIMSSLLNDSVALAATRVHAVALCDGRDL